jgi:hypothetical protein
MPRIPCHNTDPMPAQTGSYIGIKKGTCWLWLLHDELANGLGTPKQWLAEKYPPGWLVQQTVELYIIEYLTAHLLIPHEPVTVSTPVAQQYLSGRLTPDETPYYWKPPSLECGGAW